MCYFSPSLDARGRSRTGRRLLVVLAPRPGHSWYVVTARDVDKAERRRMKRRRTNIQPRTRPSIWRSITNRLVMRTCWANGNAARR
jgi:hypothetical protein